MYSPVAGVRAEDQFTAALMQQYSFGMNQLPVDLSMLTQVPATVGQQTRSDPNTYTGDFGKTYPTGGTTGSGRSDTSSSVSSVAPPPGFSGPPSNVAAAAAAQAFGVPQASMFQTAGMMPSYQMASGYSFLMPNMAGSGQNNVQHKQHIFAQSAYDDQTQANMQQQQQQQQSSDANRSAQSLHNYQQQAAMKNASYSTGGGADKSMYGSVNSHPQMKQVFDRGNYSSTSTATPPPNQIYATHPNMGYAPPTGAGFVPAAMQQLSPMALQNAHMQHDARSSQQQQQQQPGKHVPAKYAPQTNSYGGNWN
jgi:hypothetical protein